jgi:Phosphotransferase system, mannose/fructose-specific component IIA
MVPENSQLEQEQHVGIILVTHADYGSALLRAAEFIVGPISDCVSIHVDANLQVNETVSRLNEAAERLNSGCGVLVLTDMFGGTPTNMSLALLRNNPELDVITGVNLPMLLRVISKRTVPLVELSELALKAGHEGIIAAGGVLKNKIDGK